MLLLIDSQGLVRSAGVATIDWAGLSREQAQGQHWAEVLRCAQAVGEPKRCGHAGRCRKCPLRQAVLDTLSKSKPIDRREVSIPVRTDEGVKEATFVLSTSPVRIGPDELALLFLENAAEQASRQEQSRELQRQLHFARDAESFAVTAAGMAHDIKNLLVGILGYADILLAELAEPSSPRQSVEKLKQTALRASELADRMLNCSDTGQPAAEAVDINDLARQQARLMEVLIPSNVSLRLLLAADLPAVEARPHQIRQVVMNLIINAVEAIGTQKGQITVRTGTVEIKGSDASRRPPGRRLRAGRYAFLEVSDTGGGMDSRTMERVFEPLFTTKSAGRGLGLTASLSIVSEHGGTIETHSEPGKGATFRALLPVSAAAPVSPTGPPLAKPTGATVLIVDTYAGMREAAKTILQRAGFRVLTASNGRAGLELFRQHADDIQAVLFDTATPPSEAADALQGIRETRNDTKVILTSSYADEDTLDVLSDFNFAGLVYKPFEVETLLRTLREAIKGA